MTGEELTTRKDDQEETVRKRAGGMPSDDHSTLIGYYSKEAQAGNTKYRES